MKFQYSNLRFNYSEVSDGRISKILLYIINPTNEGNSSKTCRKHTEPDYRLNVNSSDTVKFPLESDGYIIFGETANLIEKDSELQ